MAGGVPARPLPRPQDAGQATQRQQKDQHDQVPFFKFGAIFLFILYFPYNGLRQYSSSGRTSPAGYYPKLGINSCVWVNNSSC
jgi:hypothetical protein